MKKLLLILLSVMILAIAGCNGAEDIGTQETAGYKTEETEERTELVLNDTEEPETKVKEEQISSVAEQETEISQSREAAQQTEGREDETKEQNASVDTETSKEQEHPKEEPATEREPETMSESAPQPTEEPTQEPEPVVKAAGYSPSNVVSLAISKCRAGGMITTQENLANTLAEGRITREEYNEYYPYDGLEGSYYSVFVETDLNIASTLSGQPLRSEDAIATYIADMLLLESSPVFNIIYVGVYNNNGTQFYEFRCLR